MFPNYSKRSIYFSSSRMKEDSATDLTEVSTDYLQFTVTGDTKGNHKVLQILHEEKILLLRDQQYENYFKDCERVEKIIYLFAMQPKSGDTQGKAKERLVGRIKPIRDCYQIDWDLLSIRDLADEDKQIFTHFCEVQWNRRLEASKNKLPSQYSDLYGNKDGFHEIDRLDGCKLYDLLEYPSELYKKMYPLFKDDDYLMEDEDSSSDDSDSGSSDSSDSDSSDSSSSESESSSKHKKRKRKQSKDRSRRKKSKDKEKGKDRYRHRSRKQKNRSKSRDKRVKGKHDKDKNKRKENDRDKKRDKEKDKNKRRQNKKEKGIKKQDNNKRRNRNRKKNRNRNRNKDEDKNKRKGSFLSDKDKAKNKQKKELDKKIQEEDGGKRKQPIMSKAQKKQREQEGRPQKKVKGNDQRDRPRYPSKSKQSDEKGGKKKIPMHERLKQGGQGGNLPSEY